MDFAIARELLENLINACERLSMHAEEVNVWQGMLNRFPEYRINADGAMAEWLHDDLKDNYHHRHLSHIYPVFPGFEITEESNPDLYRACEVALEKRLCIGLQEQTGWSLAHLACAFARMGRGNRALNALELITRSTLGVNGFTYHNDWRGMGVTMDISKGRFPAFQVEANMGWTAAILEMLAFCDGRLLKILPALPKRWSKGNVGTIRCRGGYSVQIDWDAEEGRGICEIGFSTAGELIVKLPPAAQNPVVSGLPEEAVFYKMPTGGNTCLLKMPSSGIVRIEFLFDNSNQCLEQDETFNSPYVTKF
jgi:alpha-L-fucosidase 2